MNTIKLQTIIIVGMLLVLVACNNTTISPSEPPEISASVRSVGDNITEIDDENIAVSVSCLPLGSTETLLSVEINGIENCSIPVSSTFDISWKTDNSVSLQDKQYNFIVFTMPNTVRFNGSGFLMLPPEVKLPFGFRFAPDKMRVLFPLYLPQSQKTQGTFQIKPLLAGNFTLKWDYVVVNEAGKITFSSSQTNKQSQSTTFDVVDEKPVVQERVGMEKPEKTYISPSKEYELRVFKGRFQVLYADTGELLLERAGANPNFSPGSRFIGYSTRLNSAEDIDIIDLLANKIISQEETFEVVAWGKNDSFLIIGFSAYGKMKIILPFLETNNVLITGLNGYAANAWEHSEFAIDLENALFRFRGSVNNNELYNLIWSSKESLKIEDKHYHQTISSLGFPISRLPPKIWEIEGSFKISHIGIDEKRGMRNFFNHPILVENKSPIMLKMVSIEKNKKTFRGNAMSRGMVIRLAEDTQFNTSVNNSNLIQRFGDIGWAIQRNYESLELIDWNEDWKNDEHLTRNQVNSIKGNYPKFTGLTYFKLFEHVNGDDSDIQMCKEFEFSYYAACLINGKYQLWRNNQDNEFLIIQISHFLGGNRGFTEGDLLIFSVIDDQYHDVSLGKIFLKTFGEKNREKYFNLFTSVGSTNDEVKSFLSTNSIFLISSIRNSSIIVFDPSKNEIIGLFVDIHEAHGIESLHLTQDGKFVLQINKGGHLYFYDIATQKRVLNGLYIDGEIVLYTDDGFYDATQEGAHYVTWHYPGSKQHFDFNQFESKFKRPDVIKAILTGQTLAKPDVQLLPPPTVEMVLKHPDNYAKQATVELSATSVRPITNMRLFMDGAPVVEIPVTGKRAKKTVPLELKRGKHWITAVAYNDQGYSSIPQSVMIAAPHIEAPKGNLYVLGVGVDKYPNMSYKNLNYAKRDIIAFTKTTGANPAKQYQDVYPKQLLDSEASRLNIQQALTTIAQQATVDDTVKY